MEAPTIEKADIGAGRRKRNDCISETEFVEEAISQVQAGIGLTPFVGSGVSAPSGIMMGQDFTSFLSHVVYRCINTDGNTEAWDLLRDGWPNAPREDEIKEVHDWVYNEFEALCTKCGCEINSISIRGRRFVRAVESTGGASIDTLPILLSAPFIPAILRSRELTKDESDEKSEKARIRLIIKREDERHQRLYRLHGVLEKNGNAHGGQMLPGVSPTSRAAIKERAIRSLYDWRSTLLFLSEIRCADDRRSLRIEAPQQDVIDDFNYFITNGRKPNLTHVMLCHLSRPARSRTVLTTNFDKLIEAAYTDLDQHIEEIPVSAKGALPSPDIVHARNTIVKLHGSLSETRADFSLDSTPTLTDRKRFFNYVRGGDPDQKAHRHLPSHLLVIGYSGSDQRCVEMIKYMLDADPEALVFWVCFNSAGYNYIRSVFAEEDYQGRIITTISQRPDLLLYELYQKLTKSQPPGGLGHHLSDTLPPETRYHGSQEPKARDFEALTDRWNQKIKEEFASEDLKLLVVDAVQSGMVAAINKFCSESFSGKNVWIELEDCHDTGTLACVIFQSIATSKGVYRLNSAHLVPDFLSGPVTFEDFVDQQVNNDVPTRKTAAINAYLNRIAKWRAHISELKRHFGIDSSQWLIGIYARNGPGGCAGWFEERDYWDRQVFDPQRSTTSWRKKNPYSGTEYGLLKEGDNDHERPSALVAFLSALVSEGFHIIYAPFTDDRGEKDEARKALLQKKYGLDHTRDQYLDYIPRHNEALLRFWLDAAKLPGPSYAIRALDDHRAAAGTESQFDHSIRAIDQWISEKSPSSDEYPNRTKIAYGLSLFRQSRHYTAFLNDAILHCPHRFNSDGCDNDEIRSTHLDQLLNDWKKYPRVFHTKRGGFQWLYRDTRYGIRLLANWRSIRDKKREQVAFRSRSHFSIGEWYLRAHYVTTHVNPLLEAVYHFFHCVRFSSEASKASPGKINWEYKAFWWRKGMIKLLSAVRGGGPAFRFWLDPCQAKKLFSHDAKAEVVSECHTTASAICGIRINKKGIWAEDGTQLSTDSARRWFSDAIRLCRLLEIELDTLHKRVFNRMEGNGTYRIQNPASIYGVHQSLLQKTDALSIPPVDCVMSNMKWMTERLSGSSALKMVLKASSQKRDWKRLGDLQVKMFVHGQINEPVVLLQEFVETAYTMVRRAKHLAHARCTKNLAGCGFLLMNDDINELWAMACVMCSWAEDTHSWLLPGGDDFASRERIKALTLYGLALARLRRFTEAHRKFNDAEALLSKLADNNRVVILGILEMRRAEAHLLEGQLALELALLKVRKQKVKEKTDRVKVSHALSVLKETEIRLRAPQRTVNRKAARAGEGLEKFDEGLRVWLCKYFPAPTECSPKFQPLDVRLCNLGWAKIDDAWVCLENAERMMLNKTHSSRWWGRLYALKLRSFALKQGIDQISKHPNPPALLLNRQRREVFVELKSMWHSGIASRPDDVYNRLRLLDYYIRALSGMSSRIELTAIRMKTELEKSVQNEIAEIENRLISVAQIDPCSLVLRYWGEIVLNVTKLGKQRGIEWAVSK